MPEETGQTPNESDAEVMRHRAQRKLVMICGESNGPPYDRAIERLAKMLPKAGGDVPSDVVDFIHEAVDVLGNAAKNLGKNDTLAREDLERQAHALMSLIEGSRSEADL